jgi:signal transduction histidine kinase
MNAYDRPYFQVHLDWRREDPFITGTFVSRLTGKTVFGMSRRINGPHGTFDGVILATVDAAYFHTLHDEIDIGFDGRTALLTTDGDVLMRHPYIEGIVGLNTIAAPLFTEQLPRAPEGVYQVSSIFDGSSRLVAYRRLAGLPMVVTVAYAMEYVLADWRSDALAEGILTALLGLSICGGGVAVSREVQRRRRAECEAKRSLTETTDALEKVSAMAQSLEAAAAELCLERDRSETARIAAERARIKADAANHAKSNFLAMMSHELRTPLNAIIGFSEMLLMYKGTLPEAKQVEYVGDIHESGRHLLSLVEGLLDLSRIESGKAEIACCPIHLDNLLTDAVRMLSGQAAAAAISLAVAVPDHPVVVSADETKIRQTALNIIGNALKFTEKGGSVSVMLTVESGKVLVRVTDTGIGINAGDLDHVFKPFWQGNSGYARRHGGAGLGLAIAKRLIELHDGEIRIRSKTNVGTTVEFALPQYEGAIADIERSA